METPPALRSFLSLAMIAGSGSITTHGPTRTVPPKCSKPSLGSTAQKDNGGRCLVTNVYKPLGTVQPVHLVTSATPAKAVSNYILFLPVADVNNWPFTAAMDGSCMGGTGIWT